MIYCILGDVHANIEALQAVLADCSKHKVDKFLCVGDVVGYGASPQACIQLLQDINCTVVKGNHDEATTDDAALQYFNPFARTSILWTRTQLSDTDLDWLRNLEPSALFEDDIELIHASPWMPHSYPYVQSVFDAEKAFSVQTSRICFIGHSHFPVSFHLKEGTVTYCFDESQDLSVWEKSLVNVGSVGQPRDENPLTAYQLYDSQSQKSTLFRLPYDIEQAAERIFRSDLPDVNGERLKLGR